MKRVIFRLLEDERARFVLIGGINTIVGYGLFAAFELIVGRHIGYVGSLYASYAIATLLAFYLHRRFTFRASSSGLVLVDFFRFQSVYIVSLIVNTAALPVLVEWVKMNPFIAQAVIVIITTMISYAGHKWFSFRRPAESNPNRGGTPS